MKLKINNNYISHLESLKTDFERQRFLKKISGDTNKENESAIVASCILKLEGVHVEMKVNEALKSLDALVKKKKVPTATLR